MSKEPHLIESVLSLPGRKMSMEPRWDDPTLLEKHDKPHPWRAKLRLLQSWYRETELNQPPGTIKTKDGERHVASMLPSEAMGTPLNFLNDAATAELAQARLAEKGLGGMVKPDRLWTNLLSSQPLSFNLFGPLSRDRGVLADWMRDQLRIQVDEIEDVFIEYAPKRPNRKSGSAFDCFISYRTGSRHGMLGVECKYAEDLRDQVPTDNEKNGEYAEIVKANPAIFKGEAFGELNVPITSQLLYNLCMAVDLERFEEKRVLLMTCKSDTGAHKAFSRLTSQLEDPRIVDHLFYEDVVAFGRSTDHLADWADSFERRYFDFVPIVEAWGRLGMDPEMDQWGELIEPGDTVIEMVPDGDDVKPVIYEV